MLAIVGSYALTTLGFDIGRVPKDTDIMGHPDDVFDSIKILPDVLAAYPKGKGKKYIVETAYGEIYEYELAWKGGTADEFLQFVERDGMSLDLLYALKLSHRYLKNSPHFLKTMKDIHFMRNNGAVLRPEYKDWFKRREKETLNYEHPKLNVSKKEFFTPSGNLTYIYDHDSIHQAMAHFDMPAYEYFKVGEVKCSKEKFFTSGNSTRLNSVLEEVQVLALERSQIPFKGKTDPRWSFNKAHEKVCTSIASGWWREFAWENYDKIQSMYEPDYVTKFWNGVETGTVKLVGSK